MKKNVGAIDRIVRALAGASLLMCSFLTPLPLAVRVAAFATMGTYFLITAVAGSCACYALIGKSTCPNKARI